MESNAPLERLINAVMDLDRFSESSDYAVEMRCLMRKVEWVAAEAEITLKRCADKATAKAGQLGRIDSAA